ncbi:hypothetical protein DCAR_0832008 [Daucus carota subsp. sativus]|nr:PREDICTED: protein FAM136A-like [Daucus carota subsp. sativus]XP_017221033.1 PREDICTED: protein FAM136A-like [Daucus carota subsp. sativus]WOH12504.1 hypothetical protein DCAR_0832008 [Daucus carota subsp. sativus]
MDAIAAAQERLMQERLKHKIDQINSAAQTQLEPVHHHINFTLQKAYFKCAYECFDRRRKQEDIGMCTENCSVPVLTAHHMVEDEMARFQEKLNRSLMVCRDKFETAKLQKTGTDPIVDLESCVDQSVQENINSLPFLVQKMKTSLSINNQSDNQ